MEADTAAVGSDKIDVPANSAEGAAQRLLGGGMRLGVCRLVLAEGAVCARCVLCVCGVKSGVLFETPEAELRAILCKVCEADKGLEDPAECAMCLGVLMRAEDAVQAVAAKVEALGYTKHTLSTFMLSLALPSACLIRHALVCAHLEKEMAAQGMAPVGGSRGGGLREMGVDIKEAFKGVVAASISSALGCRLYNESGSEGLGRLNIVVEYTHAETIDDREILLQGKHFKRTVRGKRKGSKRGDLVPVDSINAVMAEITKLSREDLMAKFDNKAPSGCATRPDIAVQMERESVYLGGSYCKYSREVSQTPWNAAHGNLEKSVQSLIADAVGAVYGAQQAKFMASGREDVDVRMLGDGRPFLIEIVDAKDLPHSPHYDEADAAVRPPVFEVMEKKINESTDLIRVLNFRAVGREYVKMLKAAGETKTKTYQAVIWMEKGVSPQAMQRLSASEPIVINQTTPIRVLHRRSLSVRQRTIHSLKCTPINSHWMILNLETEAGTYIKEFVHGDLGRTRPNITELLDCGDADIIQLDVVSVQL